MTTKIKIILGFVAMILIVAIVSAIGYKGLTTASEQLADLSRISTVNVAMSNSVNHINESAYHLELFMRLSDGKDMDASLAAQEKTLAVVSASLTRIADPERKKSLEQAVSRLREYVDALKLIKNALVPWYGDYKNVVVPSFSAAGKALATTTDLALQVNNLTILGPVNDLWRMLTALDAALSDFRETGTEERAASLDKLLEEAKTMNERYRVALVTDKGRQVFAEYLHMFDNIAGIYRKHKAPVLRAEAILQQAYAWDAELSKVLKTISDAADTEMSRTQELVVSSTQNSQQLMLSVSAAGLVIGILAAVSIIFGLISVLNKISAFSAAIAEGDFEHDPGIREKGEIGNMVAAMQRIPQTLKAILLDYLDLEKSIEAGAIGKRGDPGKYRGGFATLVNGTNSILARLSMVIDHIPSPVVILNKDHRIEYLNDAGQAVAGSDYPGKTCKAVFNFDDDGSNADALKIAANTRKPASAETVARPGGKTLDVSYTAIPMLDKEGRLASLLQLITDLTAVKSQQRTILQVAGQATEISGRVAAASEQLAAQVEQVSRGAEVQRSRVESTASAMTEMNSTVLEVARNAGQASEQSELTRTRADAGYGIVNQVVQSINQVNKVAATLQNNMQALGGQAESIGGVMNVISDIADQTNLLALNAAIEAARAGEAGRGFAVVADEVRKLAEKTMSATQEVSSSINAIQNATRTNIEEVNSAVKSITEATGLADSSGSALKEILELASANSAVVASIATAAEEQSATSEEINRALEEINQIVGETANGMVQSSSAVQELSSMAQELNRVMDGLK
jgi:methyl-accepting chemotaxis protein